MIVINVRARGKNPGVLKTPNLKDGMVLYFTVSLEISIGTICSLKWHKSIIKGIFIFVRMAEY